MLNFCDFLIRSFVTPLIADDTTITLYFFFMYLWIIETAFLILSIDPTDVPPNFKTIIFIDKFLNILNYVDKIHLDCNVNNQ